MVRPSTKLCGGKGSGGGLVVRRFRGFGPALREAEADQVVATGDLGPRRLCPFLVPAMEFEQRFVQGIRRLGGFVGYGGLCLSGLTGGRKLGALHHQDETAELGPQGIVERIRVPVSESRT